MQLPADIYDETLRLMMETNPRAVDQLLSSRTTVATRSVVAGSRYFIAEMQHLTDHSCISELSQVRVYA